MKLIIQRKSEGFYQDLFCCSFKQLGDQEYAILECDQTVLMIYECSTCKTRLSILVTRMEEKNQRSKLGATMIKQVTIDISTGVSHAHLLEPQENMIELVSKEVKEKEKESLNDNEWIYSSTWFELGGKDDDV